MDASSASPGFRVFPALIADLRRRLGRLLLLAVIVFVPLLFVRACAIKYIAPDEIGLRQIAVGPYKGLQKEVVQPGYRRQISSYETIQTFPRDMQIIEFTNSASETTKKHRTLPAINCPTVDGYPVAVDVTVLYRISDPFAVVSRFGFGKAYEDSVVIRFTDPAVKHYLGELRAEDFYRDAREQ